MGKARRSFGYIRKRVVKSGVRYTAEYPTVDGGRNSKTFTSKRKAEDFLRLQEKQYYADWLEIGEEDGNFSSQNQNEAGAGITLEDYFHIWRERRVESGKYSPVTMENDGRIATLILSCPVAKMKMTEIGKVDIASWYYSLKCPPVRRSAAYAKIRAVFNNAVEEGLIEVSPVKIKGAGRAPKMRSQEEREKVMNLQQLQLVAGSMPEEYAIAAWLGALAGLRIGEVAGLQRGDIDLKNRRLYVRRAFKYVEGKSMIGAPKTASSTRVVPIIDLLAVKLEEHLKCFVPSGKTAPLFANPRNVNPIGAIRDRYVRACRKNGLKGFNFHKLRATCATQLARAGATPREIMKWLGHSSWDTSLMYQLAPFDRLEEVSGKLNDTLLAES